MSETALIVGAGSGLSASLARLFVSKGMQVVLAARNVDKLDALLQETSAKAYTCDASRPGDVQKLFKDIESNHNSVDLVVYNPSARTRGIALETQQEPDITVKALSWCTTMIPPQRRQVARKRWLSPTVSARTR